MNDAYAFDTAHFCGLSPFALSHVHLSMIDTKSFNLDDDVAWQWFGNGHVFEKESRWLPRIRKDYRLHFVIYFYVAGDISVVEVSA